MFDPFEIQQQSIPEQQSPIKTRENHYAEKFTSTMTKNFMHESQAKEEQYQEEHHQGMNKSRYETLRERRKMGRSHHVQRTLQPFMGGEDSDTLQEMKVNVDKRNHQAEEQQVEEVQSPWKRQSESPEKLLKKKSSEGSEDIQDNIQVPQRKQSNILFYEDQESQAKPQQQVIKPSHQMPRYLYEIQVDSMQSAVDQDQDHVIVRTHSQYFNILNDQLIRKQVFSLVKRMHTLKMILARDNSGFKTFWPQFYLKFATDQNQIIISAKRTTARPIATYILSLSSTDFEENTPNYLGKIKSSALGDILYVFGPGYSPSKAKEYKKEQRQMIATIRYQSNFFNSGKPREFEVFTLKEGVRYFNLKGTRLYGLQPGLDQLFNHEENRDLMHIYRNKKPVWSDQLGGFMLNFKGRVPCASIKNFILDDPFQNQALVFGRKQSNEFVMQLSDKISPYLAMAVALSAFDSRIMCQ